MSTFLQLSAVKILRTGADGGHLYVSGRGELPDQGACDVYVFFRTKDEERIFEHQFSGQSVVIETDSVEFAPSVGGVVREMVSWRLI